MASFVKFYSFVERLAEKEFDLANDTLKVYLTNETPSQSGDAVKADLAEISAGNGYTAGGNQATQTSSAQSGGIYKLVCSDPATWTASGGTIGPFRYAVLYDDTHANDALISYWDYGSSITLQIGETFTVDLDGTNGVLTLE